MNWFQNLVLKLLRIIPAREKKITIKEPLSFGAEVLKNKILYRGDPAEIEQYFKATAAWDVEKTRFWASTSSNGSVRKMHSGIVGTVIDRYKDIVIADLDSIDFGEASTGAKELWDKISEDNNFYGMVADAIAGALSSGDGAFKISTDESREYPVIEFFDAEDTKFVIKRGQVREVKFYTTYNLGSKEYRLEETYGHGYVKYKLFDDAAHEVKMDTLEETKELVGIKIENGDMIAVPLKIFSSNKFKGRGKALFSGKADVIDALDEVISQWLDAVRLGRIKRYIPKNLIPVNETTGELMSPNPFDNDYIAIEDNLTENGKSQIDVSQPQISYEAYVNSYINFLDMVLQGIISPSTLGIDLKKTDNAESQREKEKVTLHVRNKIVDTLTDALPRIVSATMRTYDAMCGKTSGEYEVSVKFGEYASPDFDSTVETVGKAKQYGVMSIETAVEQMYGDTWTEEEKEEEIKRIKEESGIAFVQEPAVSTEGMVIDEGQGGKPGIQNEPEGIPGTA